MHYWWAALAYFSFLLALCLLQEKLNGIAIKINKMYSLVKNIQKIGSITAKVSFFSATLLFLTMSIHSTYLNFKVSLCIVIVIFLINLLVGVTVIVCSLWYPFIRKQLIKILGLMLLNIPIVIFYLKLLPYTMV